MRDHVPRGQLGPDEAGLARGSGATRRATAEGSGVLERQLLRPVRASAPDHLLRERCPVGSGVLTPNCPDLFRGITSFHSEGPVSGLGGAGDATVDWKTQGGVY